MSRKWMLVSIAMGIFSLIATLGACGSSNITSSSSSGTTATAGMVSFKNDIQPIFTANCVVCHQGSSPPGGLSLEPGVAYNNLVNMPSSESALMRVSPGAPDKSYLVNKLAGTQVQAGGNGARMPYGSSPLPQTQIDLIQQWISQGAKNN